MNKDNINKVIGFIGCILIILSLTPQLIIIIQNKSSKNISLYTYYVLFIAQCIWSVYGVLNNDLQITITNVLSSIITIMIIILALYYKDNE